jgi:hypothetical protein
MIDRSLGSDFGHFQCEIAESLRRAFKKLPFFGDWGRRPGSICTAWPIRQCIRVFCGGWPHSAPAASAAPTTAYQPQDERKHNASDEGVDDQSNDTYPEVNTKSRQWPIAYGLRT